MKAFEESTVEESFEIPSDYQFILPKDLVKVKVDDATLIVDKNSSIYITAFNKEQLSIIDEVSSGSKINQLQELYGEENLNLQYIVMAIFNSGLHEISEKGLKLANLNNSLFIYLTDQCNLSCPHCYRNSTELCSKPLSLDSWKKLITNFKSDGGKEVTISGGEPLVNKDFIEICKHIKSSGLVLTVLSNGTLWNKYQGKEYDIAVINSIDEIQISIDGYDERTNKIMRGKDNFQKTKNNIEWLLSINLNVSIAITPSPEIIFSNGERQKLEQFLQELAEKSIIRVTHKILPNENLKLTECDEKKYSDIISGIEKTIYPNSVVKRWVSHYFSHTEKENNCGWGNLAISANGDAYTCNRLDVALKVGNITSDSISHLIAEGQKHRDLTSVDNIEPCKHCEVRYLCNGGCRIDEFEQLYPVAKRSCNISRKVNIYKNMADSSRFIYGF